MNRSSVKRSIASILGSLLCGMACVSSPDAEPPRPTVQLGTPVPLIDAPTESPTSAAATGPALSVAGPSPAASPLAQAAPSPSPVVAGATTVTIGTDEGAEEKFVPDVVTVKAGPDVIVIFNNESTLPHNLAFQKPMSGYTKLVMAPGETDTIRVTPPGPGEYQFVCTIHPMMIGSLIVES